MSKLMFQVSRSLSSSTILFSVGLDTGKSIFTRSLQAGALAQCNFWIIQVGDRFAGHGFHRRRVGLNHIAFHADTRTMVDDFYKDYLLPRKVPVLYGGPKEYPEYSKGYYSVYFEDPDRIKLELAHIPEFKKPIP